MVGVDSSIKCKCESRRCRRRLEQPDGWRQRRVDVERRRRHAPLPVSVRRRRRVPEVDGWRRREGETEAEASAGADDRQPVQRRSAGRHCRRTVRRRRVRAITVSALPMSNDNKWRWWVWTVA